MGRVRAGPSNFLLIPSQQRAAMWNNTRNHKSELMQSAAPFFIKLHGMHRKLCDSKTLQKTCRVWTLMVKSSSRDDLWRSLLLHYKCFDSECPAIVWYARVPSKSNVADGPSGGDWRFPVVGSFAENALKCVGTIGVGVKSAPSFARRGIEMGRSATKEASRTGSAGTILSLREALSMSTRCVCLRLIRPL